MHTDLHAYTLTCYPITLHNLRKTSFFNVWQPIHTYICICICLCIYMYTHICACVYMYIYIYTYWSHIHTYLITYHYLEQNVLNVWQPMYTHMFEGIVAKPQPWYYVHLHTPGGSQDLHKPEFELKVCEFEFELMIREPMFELRMSESEFELTWDMCIRVQSHGTCMVSCMCT